jgi:uncharacterized membrane protein YfcA
LFFDRHRQKSVAGGGRLSTGGTFSTDTFTDEAKDKSASNSIWQRITATSGFSSRKDSRISSVSSVIEVKSGQLNSQFRAPVMSADNVSNPIISTVNGSGSFNGLLYPPPPTQYRESDGVTASDYSVKVQSASSVSNLDTSLGPIFSDETLGPSKSSIEYPWVTIMLIFMMWFVYVGLSIVMDLGTICDGQYTAALVCLYPPLIFACVGGIFRASSQQKRDPSSVLIGDFNFSNLDAKPAVFVFFVGVLCSLLGIGGGELIGPLLLSIGVLPQVSSATTSGISFFNTLSILINKGVNNDIDFNIAPIVFAIGMIGGYTGRVGGLWFAEKYKRPSVLIFSLVAVLILSCVFYVYELSAGGSDFNAHDLCSSG